MCNDDNWTNTTRWLIGPRWQIRAVSPLGFVGLLALVVSVVACVWLLLVVLLAVG